MARNEHIIEYPNELCPNEPTGIYAGEISGLGPTRRRHGNGVMSYSIGNRFEGEWRNDRMFGRGVLAASDGSRYDGEFANSCFHGRGAFRFGDGRRLYDGSWSCGYPMGGAALDSEGAVWSATDGGATALWEAWREGGGTPPRWTRAGVTVTAGRPPAEAPGYGEWAGAWAWERGARVEGRLRGLRPVAGVETDAGGARWDVAYCGERTLAEPLVVKWRTVKPAAEAAGSLGRRSRGRGSEERREQMGWGGWGGVGGGVGGLGWVGGRMDGLSVTRTVPSGTRTGPRRLLARRRPARLAVSAAPLHPPRERPAPRRRRTAWPRAWGRI